MGRDLTPAIVAELTAAVNRPIFLFEAFFSSTVLRLWTGLGAVTYAGNPYLGNGWLVGPPQVVETNEIRADGINVELSGVPPELVEIVLANANHNDPCTMWLGFLDAAGAIIANPVVLFAGLLDSPAFTISADSAKLELKYEHQLITLQKPNEHRYTDQGQRLFFPDDEGFKYVSSVQNWSGYWGTPQSNARLK